MKKILLIVLFMNMFLLAVGQNIPQDSVLPVIQYVESHPFDTAKIAITKRLITTIQSAYPLKAGDNEFLMTLARFIKKPAMSQR